MNSRFNRLGSKAGFFRGMTRRGLSTLELVMALPILLLIMALMVNYGVVASWKLRALTVSRHAAWSTRWPRAAAGDPRPEIWPEEAGIARRNLDPWNELDNPDVRHPVVRGPLEPWAEVREELLDPARGPREGSSSIERGFPMLGRMGTYRLDASDALLDNLWQYQRTRLSANRQRRIPAIYELAKAPPSYPQAYVQAIAAIIQSPGRQALRPLDRDDEFLGYSERFGWGTGAPDFYPRLRQFCSLDHEIARERTEDLIDRILGQSDGTASLAERMTRAWIRLYRRVINELDAAINAQPPPPPGAAAAMQGEIAQLEQQIAILEEFLDTL